MTRPSATHHQKILDDVRHAIRSGIWRPGHRIPFENDMASDYGVSRMTVNKALTQLTREGYLERRRKLGTFVCLPRVQSAVMEIAEIKREVAAAGHVHAFRLLHREIRKPGEADRRTMPLGDSRRLLVLQGLHTADGEPYCLEDRLINLAITPEAEHVAFDSLPPGGWLLQQAPWNAAQHTIRAIGASAGDARLLGLVPGAPCLEIERLTSSAGQTITFARLRYPGDRHQLVARFMHHGHDSER